MFQFFRSQSRFKFISYEVAYYQLNSDDLRRGSGGRGAGRAALTPAMKVCKVLTATVRQYRALSGQS